MSWILVPSNRIVDHEKEAWDLASKNQMISSDPRLDSYLSQISYQIELRSDHLRTLTRSQRPASEFQIVMSELQTMLQLLEQAQEIQKLYQTKPSSWKAKFKTRCLGWKFWWKNEENY